AQIAVDGEWTPQPGAHVRRERAAQPVPLEERDSDCDDRYDGERNPGFFRDSHAVRVCFEVRAVVRTRSSPGRRHRASPRSPRATRTSRYASWELPSVKDAPSGLATCRRPAP